MATKPQAVNGLTSINSSDMLNAIRNNATESYKSVVPVATRENISKIGETILGNEGMKNDFINELFNRIGKTIIISKIFENPLSMFKKGILEFGESVEEIFTDVLKVNDFYFNDPLNEDPYKKAVNNVKRTIHQKIQQIQIQSTISSYQLSKAFISESNLNNFMVGIVQSMTTSFNNYEFLTCLGLLETGFNEGYMKKVQIPLLSKDSASSIVTAIKKYGFDFTVLSTEFNKEKVNTLTNVEDQILIMTSSFASIVDVEVLASAFNLDKTSFLAQRVIIPSFVGENLKGVQAMLVDRDFLMIFNRIFESSSIYNAKGLYTNYFLTSEQIFTLSKYSNAVAFTTDEVEPEVVKPAEV